MSLTEEKEFSCPNCNFQISFLLDLSVENDRYIEDCSNCCNPLEVTYSAYNGELTSFDIHAVEQ